MRTRSYLYKATCLVKLILNLAALADLNHLSCKSTIRSNSKYLNVTRAINYKSGLHGQESCFD